MAKTFDQRLWRRAILYAAAAVLVIGAVVDKRLPPPFATPSADNHPEVIARSSQARLHVPPGFTVSVWAEGFAVPRFLLQGDHGEILLADSGMGAHSAAVGSRSGGTGQGVIYAFANAEPARRQTLLKGLNRPYGLALWRNYLYVAEADSVRRYPYDPARLTAGKGEEVMSLRGLNNGHWPRSLLFD